MRSPWSWLNSLFARRGEDPAQQLRYALPYPVAGLSLTPDEALSLSAVWACISIFATGIGSCRWNLFEVPAPNRRRLLVDDPLQYVLNTRRGPDMTAIGFREALMFVAIPFGNSYAEIVPGPPSGEIGVSECLSLRELAAEFTTRPPKWRRAP